jgi:lipopolysaccharide/colanic/teichoic acid biosynthesis glycosyltransferase
VSGFLVIVVGLALNLVVAEFFDWTPWIAGRLIRRAAQRLPSEVRSRYQDEWLAELDALPGRRISPLVFAVRIRVGASGVRHEVLGQSKSAIIGRRMAFKYGLDRVSAAALLILLLPLLLLVAVAVRVGSSGPVLSRQRRVGRDGVIFYLYKFRSIHFGCEAGDDDPRLTRVGSLLRITSMDKLPQLLNVLRGELSLIGPRPERPEFTELFAKDTGHRDRHGIKPGITGWAQVHGLRSKTSLAERVELDNYYVTHWSLGLDLRIILLTTLALFRTAS